MDNKENSKKIAKNTMLLYVRMIFIMLVSLFTSRVILNTLGIEDFGINNVVAGVVSMFGFLTSTLSAAVSRFYNYELGKGNGDKLRTIYSTSINIMIVLSVGIALLIEIVGVWFLNTKLNIPISRLDAANWVLQFSILGFVLNLINVPFNAAIIAHERMDVFAYISIFEVSAKLAVAYLLYISPFDKLKTYAVLFCAISLLLRFIYGWYCSRNFEECRYSKIIDKKLLKEMSGFAGWNLLGSGAYIFNTQGINIVTNLFFGVTVNAARGVVTQVEGVIKHFVSNFTTALNPQIVKSYASNNMDYMFKLVCRGAKYSYLLMLFLAIPIILEADIILKLWLGNPPEDAALFVRLSLIGAMMDVMGNSTANACWATGKVKKYYQLVASVGCLPFFISWCAFALGTPAYFAYISFIVIYFILIFVKLYILKGLMNFPVIVFIKEVLIRVSIVTAISIILPSLIWYGLSESIMRLFLVGLASIISCIVSTYYFGLEYSEKRMIKEKVLSRIKN